MTSPVAQRNTEHAALLSSQNDLEVLRERDVDEGAIAVALDVLEQEGREAFVSWLSQHFGRPYDPQELTVECIQKMAAKAYRESAQRPTTVICSPKQYHLLMAQMTGPATGDHRRAIQAVGREAMQIATPVGMVQVLQDPDCPEDAWYLMADHQARSWREASRNSSSVYVSAVDYDQGIITLSSEHGAGS